MVVAPGLQRPNPVNSALAFINLKPWSERTLSQQELAAALQPKLFSLPGVLAFPSNPPSLGQSFASRPVQFVVQANSYAELQTLVDVLINKGQQFAGLVNLDVDLKLNKPQLRMRSTATRRRTSASRWRRSAARSKLFSAAARLRVSNGRENSTTSS